MFPVRCERSANGFRIMAHTLQWGGLLFAAFVCAGLWMILQWFRQELQNGARWDAQHLFFGIPMALAALTLSWHALRSIAGQVVVSGNAEEILIREGVGPWGTTHRLHAREVASIDIGPLLDRATRRSAEVVRLHLATVPKRVVKFGDALGDSHRKRIVELLKLELNRT
jgi:hypothetical protein